MGTYSVATEMWNVVGRGYDIRGGCSVHRLFLGISTLLVRHNRGLTVSWIGPRVMMSTPRRRRVGLATVGGMVPRFQVRGKAGKSFGR